MLAGLTYHHRFWVIGGDVKHESLHTLGETGLQRIVHKISENVWMVEETLYQIHGNSFGATSFVGRKFRI